MNPPVGVKLCLVPRWGVELAGGWVGGKVGPILTSLSDTLHSTIPYHMIPCHSMPYHTIYPIMFTLCILCVTAYKTILNQSNLRFIYEHDFCTWFHTTCSILGVHILSWKNVHSVTNPRFASHAFSFPDTRAVYTETHPHCHPVIGTRIYACTKKSI